MNSVYTQPWKTGLKEALHGCTSIFILADSNLPSKYLNEVVETCGTKAPITTHSIIGGEQIKTLQEAENLYLELQKVGSDRDTVLVCLGGGTVTDLGGYVASNYKRGIDYVLLPTTLLAMVDAAIGGKTGVNLSTYQGLLKNQIGTFHQSKFTGLNTMWLESLPEREIRSGKSEMIKHALLLGDTAYIEQVLDTKNSELPDLIKKSAQIKQNIVNQDPHEQGIRAQLNLGHTVAHALETLAAENGEDLRHGEAVAWGLAFTIKASSIHTELQNRITKDIKINLPKAEKMWEVMGSDKKNKSGNVTDVMITETEPLVDFIWSETEFTKMWQDFCKKHA
ncbi:MAG: 3-dehydroquinate synthase [Crocinitomicaceae bacterium]|nr:3-dehydroquinate synthase [Crocinitomicaceae bacterium]|tara:strand:+ start:2830 stop:3840 length:1011 start_codon:yes stop_codon:yes gene_type:complete